MKNGFRIAALALFIGFVSTVTLCAYFSRTYHVSRIYREGGTMENLEIVLLALSCFGFLASALVDVPPERWVKGAGAFLCYSMMLREIDIEWFPVPRAVEAVITGRGRAIVFVVIFVAMIAVAASDWKYYLQASYRFLRSRRGIVLMAGGLCLIGGHVTEEVAHSALSMFVEESFELLGYGLVFLASLPSRLAQ